MSLSEEEIVERDPGAPQFVSVAEKQRLQGNHELALVILLLGLSHAPSNHQGRLLLARVFYELECIPFAIEQLKKLCEEFPQHKNIQKLYHKMGGEIAALTSKPQTGNVIAHAEIDFESIDDLEQDR
jgi:hypothetical protein